MKDSKIVVGYGCNNRCSFCMDRLNVLLDRTTEEIYAEIDKAGKHVNFLGGEITIRKDCFDIIRYAAKERIVNITTNGRMLAYPGFCQKLIDCQVGSIIVSIHGDEKTHDKLTGVKGSYKQTMEGIANLKSLGFENIGSNTTICSENYSQLPKIAQMLVANGIERSEFIYCYNDDLTFVPKVTHALPYIMKSLEIHSKLKIQNVPIPCLFADVYERLGVAGTDEISNLSDTKKSVRYRKAEEHKDIRRIKPSICDECRADCLGVWQRYIDRFGDGEMAPIKYGAFDVFWDYSSFLSKRLGIKIPKDAIFRLFRDIPVLKENQKFDISLSTNMKFRFSYNDYSERDKSYAKYVRFFEDLGMDTSLLKELMDIMQPNNHQTTVGAEIGDNIRLKLYFEDFEYDNDEVLARLDKILKVLGMPKVHFKGPVNSIGIDFPKINLKIYTRHKDIEFSFGPKDDEFFLIAHRFDRRGTLISKKRYKVFNIIKYDDRKANINKIQELIDGDLKAVFRESLKVARLVPVLFSVDEILDKTDVYFTLQPAHENFDCSNSDRISRLQKELSKIKISKKAKKALEVVYANPEIRYQSIDQSYQVGREPKLKLSVPEVFNHTRLKEDIMEIAEIYGLDLKVVKKVLDISDRYSLRLLYSLRENGLKIYYNIPKRFDVKELREDIDGLIPNDLSFESPRLIGFEIADGIKSLTVYNPTKEVSELKFIGTEYLKASKTGNRSKIYVLADSRPIDKKVIEFLGGMKMKGKVAALVR